jgi:uncharacterized membrane protein YfhO
MLRVGLNSSCATVLSTNRTFAPGWRADIDGEEVAVRQSNLAFMAVDVPAGKHIVELSYRPHSLLLGLWISLLTLAAMGVGVVFLRPLGSTPDQRVR